ncbi:MAG: TolC family protein [Burkholderiaceae bacterium]
MNKLLLSWAASTATPVLLLAAAAAPIFMAGCATFAADGGFDKVADLTRERVGVAPVWHRVPGDSVTAEVRSRIDELLGQPLSADASVELALLSNRGLQARFARLGVAEADRVRAGRLANPRVSFGHLRGGGVTEIDRSVMFDLLGLLTLPVASAVAAQRLEEAQYQAALAAVGVAAEAREAFFGAVAAREQVRYGEQVVESADVASELAQRMQQAGNLNKLDRMREHAFHAEAVAGLARARHRSVAARERLTRALGLGEQLSFELPERLPDLPQTALEPRDAERTAVERRLDVRLARLAAEATARSLGLTRATRFVNVLEAGYVNSSETGAPRRDGYEIELELPLFDFGATRAARAEALYLQAFHRTAAVATEARSQVRESYSAYRMAWDLARHYRDEIVPLRRRISEETLLRYNGMLVSVFELLADSREQVIGVTAYIEALRDFWIADSRLQTVLAAGPATAAVPGTAALPVTDAGPATSAAPYVDSAALFESAVAGRARAH